MEGDEHQFYKASYDSGEVERDLEMKIFERTQAEEVREVSVCHNIVRKGPKKKWHYSFFKKIRGVQTKSCQNYIRESDAI